jgi:hypothetical protein
MLGGRLLHDDLGLQFLMNDQRWFQMKMIRWKDGRKIPKMGEGW